MRSLYALAVAASALMFAISLVLYFAAIRIDHRTTFIQIAPTTCVTLIARGLDCRIAFYNDPITGPFQGSVISIVGGKELKTTAFGDTLGMYYRNFQWVDRRISTLTVSLLYGLVGFGILPAFCLLRRWRHTQSKDHRTSQWKRSPLSSVQACVGSPARPLLSRSLPE